MCQRTTHPVCQQILTTSFKCEVFCCDKELCNGHPRSIGMLGMVATSLSFVLQGRGLGLESDDSNNNSDNSNNNHDNNN